MEDIEIWKREIRECKSILKKINKALNLVAEMIKVIIDYAEIYNDEEYRKALQAAEDMEKSLEISEMRFRNQIRINNYQIKLRNEENNNRNRK